MNAQQIRVYLFFFFQKERKKKKRETKEKGKESPGQCIDRRIQQFLLRLRPNKRLIEKMRSKQMKIKKNKKQNKKRQNTNEESLLFHPVLNAFNPRAIVSRTKCDTQSVLCKQTTAKERKRDETLKTKTKQNQ